MRLVCRMVLAMRHSKEDDSVHDTGEASGDSALSTRRLERSSVGCWTVLRGGPLAMAAAAALAGALFATTPAFAAKKIIYLGTPRWEIAIDGHSYAVKAGGAIAYHACETVEALVATVGVEAKGIREGFYVARIAGPTVAGESLAIERSLHGASARVEYSAGPSSFPKLSRRVEVGRIVPGTYTFEMTIDSKTAKATPVETINLEQEAGC